MKHDLDALDISILAHLEEDGRRSYSEMAEALGVAEKPEGAGAADFLEKRGRRKIEARFLPFLTQHGMIEIDLEIHAETVVRGKLGPFILFFDHDRILDAYESLGRVLFCDTR